MSLRGWDDNAGIFTDFIGRLLFRVTVFSLSIGFSSFAAETSAATKSLARGPVETSSPEDRHKTSLSGLAPNFIDESPLIRARNGLGTPKPDPQGAVGNQGSGMGPSPLLTEGVFPYKVDPLSSLIAATITVAYKVWKETGKVDAKSVLWILNSADFYAGLVGATSSGGFQIGAAAGTKKFGQWISKKYPLQVAPAMTSTTVAQLANFLNGITHAFSVSAGFEIYSQLWMVATKNIPEARTVSGLYGADAATWKRIGNQLLQYVSTPDAHKRVWNSVWAHRILTFEFLSMNVALYAGMVLGDLAGKYYGKGNIWARRLGSIGLSILLGWASQQVPDSWKNSVNLELLDAKIWWHRGNLKDTAAVIQQNIRANVYPPESKEEWGLHYVSKGLDLHDDMRRLMRSSDLLRELEQVKALTESANPRLWGDAVFKVLNETQEELNKMSEGLDPKLMEDYSRQVESWIHEGKSDEEIEALGSEYFSRNPQEHYYRFMLSGLSDRIKKQETEAKELMQSLTGEP